MTHKQFESGHEMSHLWGLNGSIHMAGTFLA